MAGRNPVCNLAQRLAPHCLTWHLIAIRIAAASLLLLLLLLRQQRRCHIVEDSLPAEVLA